MPSNRPDNSRTVGAEVVRPVAIERGARRRRWAVCLPVLVALLLTLGSATAGGDTGYTSKTGPVGTALLDVAASAHPVVPGGRVEVRLFAKRAETWAIGSLAGVARAAYRLAVSTARWTAPAVPAGSAAARHGEAYRGRGPPARV
jgi:hypothetical protein